jgi:predicted RNA binding protein YcfA (HicA-like mRNA interferase family)
MGKWTPCKRRDFIRKLKKLGFGSPEPGGKHFYMRYESFTFTVPNNPEYSVSQVKMLIKEIELGIKKKISLEEWEKL